MSIIKREPMSEFERLFAGTSLLLPKLGWDMAVDVFEDKGNVVAKMSIPGVDAKDIDITLEGETLVISGRREEELKTEERDYYSKEIRRGSFSRSVSLPKMVDASAAKADCRDGILTITMPILKGQKKQTVRINVAKK